MYGDFIRAVRRSRGLSQRELATIVGIDQPNLSAYENGRQMPSADMLNKLVVGCGYLLEAVAGGRVITAPLPRLPGLPDLPPPSPCDGRDPGSPMAHDAPIHELLDEASIDHAFVVHSR